jgi:hypothetical protein
MSKFVKKVFKRDEEGQGLAEYGLILALIAVVCVAASHPRWRHLRPAEPARRQHLIRTDQHE